MSMTLLMRSKSRDSNNQVSEAGEMNTRPKEKQKPKRARGYLRLQDLAFRTKWACRKLAKKGKAQTTEHADNLAKTDDLSPPVSPASRKSDDDIIISEIYQPTAKQDYVDRERSKEVRYNTAPGVPFCETGQVQVQGCTTDSNVQQRKTLESRCADQIIESDDGQEDDVHDFSLPESLDLDEEGPTPGKNPSFVMLHSILFAVLHTYLAVPIISAAVVVIVMYRYRKDFRSDAVPWQVAFTWNVFMFSMGRTLAYGHGKVIRDEATIEDDDVDEIVARAVSIISPEKSCIENQEVLQQRNTIFLRAMARASTRPAKFRSVVTNDEQIILPEDFFTTVYPPSVPTALTWVNKFRLPPSSLLFERIPTINEFHRFSEEKSAHGSAYSPSKRISANHCSFRGMDILLTDLPQEKMYRNSLLNRCGLRTKPTMIINILAPWASVVFYLQLPPWVRDFDKLDQEAEDSKEVQMLKRFLNGSDAYKNRRFKVIPQIVEGPLPIRMLAQAKKNAIIKGTSLPLTWHKDSEFVDKHGNVQKAILEVDCDIAGSSKLVRTSASLLRRYMHLITADLAFMLAHAVDDDDVQTMPPEEVKHSVCLGVARVEKIIPEMCAVMPPLSETESIHRASVCMRVGEC